MFAMQSFLGRPKYTSLSCEISQSRISEPTCPFRDEQEKNQRIEPVMR